VLCGLLYGLGTLAITALIGASGWFIGGAAGHHRTMQCVEFTLHGLSIELDRPNDNLLNITFTMAPSDFEEASRVVKIIADEIDPQ